MVQGINSQNQPVSGDKSSEPPVVASLERRATSLIEKAEALTKEASLSTVSNTPDQGNSKVMSKLEELEKELKALKKTAGETDGDDTVQFLTSQIRLLNQLIDTLFSQLMDRANTLDGANSSSNISLDPETPKLTKSSDKGIEHLSTEKKTNLFMVGTMLTVMFEAIMELNKQKLLNKDTYRELAIQQMSDFWSLTKLAAEDIIAAGKYKAESLKAAAIQNLIIGCIQVGTGVAAMVNLRNISKEVDNLGKGVDGGKKIEMSEAEKQQLVQHKVTNSYIGIFTQFGSSALSKFVEAGTNFAQADFAMKEAYAEASKALHQALAQVAQDMMQKMMQRFDEEGRDIEQQNQMLQKVSEAITRMLKG